MKVLLCLLGLVVASLAGCGGATLDAPDGSVDSGLDAALDGSVDALPVSYCFDGVSERNRLSACHCVRVCDIASSYKEQYLCSQAEADNMPGQGNALGTCLDGRCLDAPWGASCP